MADDLDPRILVVDPDVVYGIARISLWVSFNTRYSYIPARHPTILLGHVVTSIPNVSYVWDYVLRVRRILSLLDDVPTSRFTLMIPTSRPLPLFILPPRADKLKDGYCGVVSPWVVSSI